MGVSASSTSDPMMASLGCCQEGSPCWNGRVAHKGDAELGRIQLVKKSKTAYTPGLATVAVEQHSSVAEAIVRPHPSYSPEEKARQREISPTYSSDASNACTPRKVVEEWDADYGIKIVYRREDVDDYRMPPARQSYFKPTGAGTSRSSENRASRSETPPYISLVTAQQTKTLRARNQGAPAAAEDTNPPRVPTPMNQTLNLSPISAPGPGYPASPSPVRSQREHLVQAGPDVWREYKAADRAPPSRSLSCASIPTNVVTYVDGLQICTPYK